MSYNIDQFSKITGISKLVLRTWENRYDFLTPSRTNTNIRYYSDQMLVKGLKTKFLIDSGYKISHISNKTNDDIDNIIQDLKSDSGQGKSFEYFINKMIEAGITYNTELFNKTYNECLKDFDLYDIYMHIILPTFSKIGIFWLTNRINPAQEHFLSEMFKQKMYSEINILDNHTKNSKLWLLFLPPEEYHEIGLLFSRFLLLKNGFKVIYLGANVPLPALKQVATTQNIDNLLFFSISNLSKTKLIDTIVFLNKEYKKTNKFLVTNLEKDISILKKYKVNLIQSVPDFVTKISK